jgi:ABC-type lipoprotein export system ATPase subunit
MTMTDDTPHPLVRARGLTKSFGHLDVLRAVDLDVGRGESVAIVGPSGSGKSTLLNIIGGLATPTAGQVCFDAADLHALSADALAAFRNREMGYVFQAHHLLPQCTALENVLVPTLIDPDRARRAAAVERGEALLELVGLGARIGHRPSRLSGGECQRVAVVRALINRPRLLLADEPTGSLDAASSDLLGELLIELNQREAVALITVTHSTRLAARMQHTYELREGRLAALEADRGA